RSYSFLREKDGYCNLRSSRLNLQQSYLLYIAGKGLRAKDIRQFHLVQSRQFAVQRFFLKSATFQRKLVFLCFGNRHCLIFCTNFLELLNDIHLLSGREMKNTIRKYSAIRL